MTLGTRVILVTICQIFFIARITSYILPEDSRTREVVVAKGIGQTIECPGQSRITILFSQDFPAEKINQCNNDFYEFYVSRRCTFKRRCELPRSEGLVNEDCRDSTVKLRYKCVHGKLTVRMAPFSPIQQLTLACPFDTSIRMMKATHGDVVENCLYTKAFEFIQESCRYKRSCTVDFESIPGKWECQQSTNTMEIDYTCQNYTVNVVSAIKGESLSLQCRGDYMIHIQSANYSSGTGQCFDPFSEMTVIDRCSSKNKCSFPGDISQYFMNFCHRGQRRLEVAYSCIAVKDTKKFIVFQNGMLDLACKRGQIIQIVSAKYGNGDLDCWSITTQARLNQECDGKTKCCASANDNFLGKSMCPKNTRKSLTVIYQCQAITNLETLENVALEERNGKVCESIRFEMAASFGKLTSESIKMMNEDLLIMIGGSLPKLRQMSVETFDDVIRYMKNIEFLTFKKNSYTERRDSFNDTEFGIKNFIDRENMKFAAVSWYRRLVGSLDILSEAHIDIDELSDLICTVGASVHSLKTSVFNREGGNRTVVDMAILRFPDFKNPFFLIYNIKLNAWWKTSRLLIFEKAKSGMSGEFRSMQFLPNHEFIKTNAKKFLNQAIDEVNSLFDMPIV